MEEMNEFEMDERCYDIKVTITTIHSIYACSKQEAIDCIRSDYEEEYGIYLKDEEIKILED